MIQKINIHKDTTKMPSISIIHDLPQFTAHHRLKHTLKVLSCCLTLVIKQEFCKWIIKLRKNITIILAARASCAAQRGIAQVGDPGNSRTIIWIKPSGRQLIALSGAWGWEVMGGVVAHQKCNMGRGMGRGRAVQSEGWVTAARTLVHLEAFLIFFR